MPKIDKFLLFLLFLSLSSLVITLFDRYLSTKLLLMILHSLILFPLIGYYLWNSGNKFARSYAIASSFLAAIVLWSLLRFIGIVPSTEINFWAGRLAFVIEGIILAVALADRISILKEERDTAHEKIKQTLLNDKEILEKEVKKRTLELEEAKKRAEKLARVDELTKLFNRRAFLEEGEYLIKNAKRYNTPLTLICLDIDHFKKVNDTYGHEGGDIILENFSSTLRHSVRETDMCARIGGEEFVVMLPHTPLKEAKIVAEKLRLTIFEIHTDYKNRSIRISASLGVSDFNSECDNLTTLLGRADNALYQAKNSGRNSVHTC